MSLLHVLRDGLFIDMDIEWNLSKQGALSSGHFLEFQKVAFNVHVQTASMFDLSMVVHNREARLRLHLIILEHAHVQVLITVHGHCKLVSL